MYTAFKMLTGHARTPCLTAVKCSAFHSLSKHYINIKIILRKHSDLQIERRDDPRSGCVGQELIILHHKILYGRVNNNVQWSHMQLT